MRRAALVLALVLARPVAADDLAFDVTRTSATVGAALLVWGATLAGESALAPASCRWCDPTALDRHARAHLRWSDPDAAGVLSNVTVIALPVALAGADLALRGDLRRASEDAIVAGEAVVLAELATEAVKLLVARRRPDAVGLPARRQVDDDLSFFSGHAAGAFAAAGAFGTIAHLRGDSSAALVYAAGFGAASVVAYLRVAADKHWLTDVGAGAAMGAAFGVAAPLLLHRKASGAPTLAPAPGGVSIRFAF